MSTRILAFIPRIAGGSSGRSVRWSVFALGILLVFSGAAARAVDLSGTYSDKGTALATDDSKLSGEISLHALLSLNFDAKRDVYESTDEVKFEQTAEGLDARIYNTDGKEVSKAQWRKDREYREEDKKLTLTLRGAGDQAGVLVFEPSSDGKYLEVTVARLTPTTFGPVAQKIGSVIFPKLK